MPLKDEEWLIVDLSNTALKYEKNPYSVLTVVFF